MSERGLSLHDVTKNFDDVVAVEDFSLDVEETEFVSLLGPSGCGKTTTLRIIAGLEQPTSGEVTLTGRSLNGKAAYERNISLMFQDFALFPHLTVFDNVAYVLRLRDFDKTEIESKVSAMLESVDMTPLAERRPAQLSGGQQQRVALGRALVVDPDLLLLDEPLGALDAHLRIQMQAELRQLQRRLNIPFVYVTHNQNEALSMSDRIVVMRDGHIEQVDPPEVLFTRPRTEFVASFVGNNNILSLEATTEGVDTIFSSLDGTFRTGDGSVPDESEVALVFGADVLKPWRDDMSEQDWNRIDGEIDGIEIVGSITTYVVKLSSGTAVTWEEHGTGRTHRRLEAGDRVSLGWPTDNSVVLPRSR